MKGTLALGILTIVAATAPIDGQQSRRPMSPAGSSATQIGGDHFDGRQGFVGGKWIEITYGRPITRGRDLFDPDDFAEFLNDGAPVWRAGANVSTRLFNELPLELGGTRSPLLVSTLCSSSSADTIGRSSSRRCRRKPKVSTRTTHTRCTVRTAIRRTGTSSECRCRSRPCRTRTTSSTGSFLT